MTPLSRFAAFSAFGILVAAPALALANFRHYGDFEITPGVRFQGVTEDVRSGVIQWNSPVTIANGISFPHNNFNVSLTEAPHLGFNDLIFTLENPVGVRTLALSASGVYSAWGGTNALEVAAIASSALQVEINEINNIQMQGPYLSTYDDTRISSRGETYIEVPWNIELFLDLEAALEPGQLVTSATVILSQVAIVLPESSGMASVRTDSLRITAIGVPEPRSLGMCAAAAWLLPLRAVRTRIPKLGRAQRA